METRKDCSGIERNALFTARDENQVAVLNKDPDNTVKVVQGLSNATVLSSSQNGLAVIHELDTVLSLPASLSATATAAGLNSFAVTVQNVLPGLLGSLEGIEGITVFAPINDAFANLVGLLSSIPTGTIGNVIANRELPIPLYTLYSQELGRCIEYGPLSLSRTRLIKRRWHGRLLFLDA